jgi:mono/diheme cytochrome c family protein
MKRKAVETLGRLERGPVLYLVLLAGCTPAGGTQTNAGGSSPGDYNEGESSSTGNATAGSSGDPDGTGAPSGTSCVAEADAAEQVLSDHCAVCHADGAKNGGFAVARDLAAIVSQNLVSPGNLRESRIYSEASSGDMPPTGPDLNTQEVTALGNWILCLGGEPDTPVASNDAGVSVAPDAGAGGEGGGGGIDVGDGDDDGDAEPDAGVDDHGGGDDDGGGDDHGGDD